MDTSQWEALAPLANAFAIAYESVNTQLYLQPTLLLHEAFHGILPPGGFSFSIVFEGHLLRGSTLAPPFWLVYPTARPSANWACPPLLHSLARETPVATGVAEGGLVKERGRFS